MIKVGIVIVLIIALVLKILYKRDMSKVEVLEGVFEIENKHLFLFTTVYSMGKIHLVMNENKSLDGSFLTNKQSVSSAKGEIERGYGIIDKQSAKESLEWLETEGDRVTYEICKEESNEENNELRDIDKEVLDEINEKYGENKSLKGWDFVRGNEIALYSYMCGYLDEEELFEYCDLFCELIYNTFDGWDDLVENVALGHKFLNCNLHGRGENAGNTIYEKHMKILKESNIYTTVSWDISQH